MITGSVSDPVCLSRIRILIFVYPGSQKNHKIKNYINSELAKKKFWSNLQRILERSTQKLSLSSQKYGFGIQDPEKTYSGSLILVQGSKRHRIPDPGSRSATLLTGVRKYGEGYPYQKQERPLAELFGCMCEYQYLEARGARDCGLGVLLCLSAQ